MIGFLAFSAHESLDGHVAYWFGLNQSKYQWALDDYYEANGKVKIWTFLVCCLYDLTSWFMIDYLV